MDREQQIRERAYAIWQRQGGVHGLQDEHWRQAESEMSAEEDAGLDAGPQPKALAPKRKTSKRHSGGESKGKVQMGHIPGDPVVK